MNTGEMYALGFIIAFVLWSTISVFWNDDKYVSNLAGILLLSALSWLSVVIASVLICGTLAIIIVEIVCELLRKYKSLFDK